MLRHSQPQTLRCTIATCVMAFAVFLIGRTPTFGAEDESVDLAAYYGFEALEVFKLERRSSNMLAGDLNHDGRTDLVLADNSHSRLDLLIQRAEKPAESKSTAGSVNTVQNDWRFEHRKLAVDKQVSAMTLGDFDADGRTDIAYFGVPDRLVVLFQPDEGEWTRRLSYRLADVPAKAWCVAAGDLNHDQRDDLAVLGSKETYVLLQSETGLPATPERLMNTADQLGLLQVADVDGDGRDDLCYLDGSDDERALCARLQDAGGRLGPELRFELGPPRGVTMGNVDGRPGHEIVVLDSRTGRVKMLGIDRPQAKADALASRLTQYGFGSAAGRNRDLALGDLDGDGATDVVVTDPETARMLVFRQHQDRGLDLGVPFPGLAGAEQVRIADLDGDNRDEVFVLSAKEKTIGVCRLEEKRLTFPQPLPTVHEPAAVEVADLDGDQTPEVVYISRQRDGRDSKYALGALRRGEDGEWQHHTFPEQPDVPESAHIVLELSAPPARLVTLDANRDRRPDFLVFLELGRPPLFLATNEHGIPTPIVDAGGIGLGDLSVGSVFVGRSPNDSLLVARENFARSLRLDEQDRWQVLDQYNAAESNARIVGAASLELDGQPGAEIVLVDSGVRKLRVMRQDAGVFRPWREVETGAFSFRGTHVADLNHDRRDDLLLFGDGQFAVLYAGRTDPVLREVATFETKLEKTFFNDVAVGDVNGDGRPDVAAIDTRSHFVELLNFEETEGLRHALHFKVFEEKSFTREGGSGSEPRETVIADVTGDGRADLVLLVHDRVLVYPQDAGGR